MPRWSYAYKLSDYRANWEELQDPGVYELGYFNQEDRFVPRYIGMASVRLWNRIEKYGRSGGRGSHNSFLKILTPREYDKVWYRYMKTKDGSAAAIREALMLNRHLYGPLTRYEWNKKREDGTLVRFGYLSVHLV